MKLLKIFRQGNEEVIQEKKVYRLLRSLFSIEIDVRIETCFYIQFLPETELELSDEERRRVERILGDSWQTSLGLSDKSSFQNAPSNSEVLVEIGPRLSFSTPWSTNCVSICHSAGLKRIERLEKGIRYLISYSKEPSDAVKQKTISSLHDPMTQLVYVMPLETFLEERSPEKWTTVDVLKKGDTALREINSAMGLAFDEWDIKYYTTLFQEKVKRNPTTVELFDLAQSNSEHSRHCFFKGEYILEGEKLPDSLFDMVISTNSKEFTNDNNVIKFSDNSSGIKGWELQLMTSSNPCEASPYSIQTGLQHIIFTAETHNFPTGVAPFSGATTGTGGRIRDVQAAGRGGRVIAGSTGYCFGNLRIPGYDLDWEEDFAYPSNFAPSVEVAIEASNGASDYGNKFGEPVICGFARSFGLEIGIEGSSERREWIKPIMFSGGIGAIDDSMITKESPAPTQLVIKVGGPVYRIGVGGGAASSIQVQGDNEASRDLGAVQRGDAEMEQKLNRVIRGCLEMKTNPILAIHDQGAGGNANVLKELMEGSGGAIFTKEFSVGDPTLSTLEIWGAEYQESNAMLVHPDSFEDLEKLCNRERCPVNRVGVITNDQKVRLIESEFDQNAVAREHDNLAVNLNLDWVLGKMPRKVFNWTKEKVSFLPLSIPSNETPISALKRVLRLPSVASKRYLTNKVDRSVTGLIAQQQCVGPFQTPVADVAVVALSYFSKEGAATSIGEQPIKILVDPKAGARMTVLEALSNLASCGITCLKDVKCSANWMWAAKLPGEGHALFEACKAMCDVMKLLGVAVDGGKDSLSMAARIPSSGNKSDVVKAPGSLVVSAYAPCPDITKVVTPDLKSPIRGKKGILLLVKPTLHQNRLGGSALAQVYKQMGTICPDFTEDDVTRFIAAFSCIQELIKDCIVLALHDISDGGLITTLIEMAISGWGGIEVNFDKCESYSEASPEFHVLFNEETGWVMEIAEHHLQRVQEVFEKAGARDIISTIGHTTSKGWDSKIECFYDSTPMISLTVIEATHHWEETSYQLETLQMNPTLAKEEFNSFKSRKHSYYNIPFIWREDIHGGSKGQVPLLQELTIPRVAVIREEGSNGDREMAAAFIQAGFIVYDVTMSDLAKGFVDLNSFTGIAFPGGFSYADVLGSAVGWASSITEREHVAKALDDWRQRKDTFSLGVCNGCQLMALLGWIGSGKKTVPSIKLVQNDSGRFESRWSKVKIGKSKSILLAGMEDAQLGVWVAHGEGKFIYETEKVERVLHDNDCVALTYIDDNGCDTEAYPYNPNGSKGGVAGITSLCGRHLALMPHPERCFLSWQWPSCGIESEWFSITSPWAKLFQNAFDWCTTTD